MFKANVTNKVKYTGWKVKNYCKRYHLENKLYEESFNRKYSDPSLYWVFNTRRANKTKLLIRSILDHIENNSMIIIVIYGLPNSGKSEAAQTIALFWKSYFYLRKSKRVKIYIATSTAKMRDILKIMNEGDIAIRDESPKLSGKGSVNAKKYLDNLTKVIRAAQNSFIFIDPMKIEAAVVHFYLETAGKDVKNRKLRFILYDKDQNILGRVYIPLHVNEIMRRRYKKEKNANIESMKRNAGMVTSEVDYDRLKRDMKILFEECKKNDVKKKGEIDGLIPLYNMTCSNDDEMIKGEESYMKILTSNVYRLMRSGSYGDQIIGEGKIKKKAKSKSELINYSKGISFPEFCKRNVEDKKEAIVAEGLARGDSYAIIAHNYSYLKYSEVLKYGGLLRGKGKEDNLGLLFEKWNALNLGVPVEEIDDYVAGHSDKPDLIFNDKIYSFKFRIGSHKSRDYFLQSSDLRPEYEEALRRQCTYTLIYMNAAWYQKLHFVEVDPRLNDDKIIIDKYDSKAKKIINI